MNVELQDTLHRLNLDDFIPLLTKIFCKSLVGATARQTLHPTLPPDRSGLVPTAKNLSAFNTLGLPCMARRHVHLTTLAQLPTLSRLAAHAGSLLVLGGGSNVVLPYELDGLVARVGFPGIRLLEARPDAWIVEAGGGVSWHGFVSACLDQGWDGLENLALIPGTVGAAPVQNIGAYGVELKDRFLSLSAWDVARGEMIEMDADDCRFAYRDSMFKHEMPGRWLITAVRFTLPRPWQPVLDYPDLRRHAVLARSEASITARQVHDAVCAIRRAKLPDPAIQGNAGSFFKNPLVNPAQYQSLLTRFPGLIGYAQPGGFYKLAAGWLIEQCGWKGRRLGPVGMHERQALVLVNDGGATATEVMALAQAVQASVAERYGVRLEPEPVIVPGAARQAFPHPGCP